MVLKRSSKKLVDLRMAPKDIIDSVKRSRGLGAKLDGLSRVGRKLTGLLRSNILRKTE